jgi:hypothetical protein
MSDSNDLSHHILPNSAQLVGVCMMVIPVVKLLHFGQVGLLLDKLLAIDTLIFMASAGFSYAAMRKEKYARFEKFADQVFMLGLMELGICAILLAFEVI